MTHLVRMVSWKNSIATSTFVTRVGYGPKFTL